MASKHTVGKGALGRLRSWGQQFRTRRRGAEAGDSLRARSLNLESLERRELLSVYAVTNNNDSGAGSLRQAILDANASANGTEADRIEFNIAGEGVKTIELLSALPAITDPVVIDGYTQAGSSVNTLSTGNNAVLMVELDGTSAGAANGLTITAGNTTVQGLVINSFQGDGIALQQGDSNVIQGNRIGTDAAGTADLGNTGNGISVTLGSQKNTIGSNGDGTNDPAEVNLISGNNGSGVAIDGYGKNDLESLETPSNNGYSALDAYLANGDSTYSYSLATTLDGDGYTVYVYDMISQTWNPDGMVLNRSVWQHYLEVCVPDIPYQLSDTALLIVSGGSNKTSPPTEISSDMEMGAQIAVATGLIVVDIPTIPNEPLQFADEPWDHREDALIAYTFDKYMDTGDGEWPAYLPMVKGVIRAMDTVQAVVPGLTGGILDIDHFALYGESKRGWTAQLAAATDPQARVSTLVGGVSEVSNLGMEIQYWKQYWEGANNLVDGYPVHVEDYANYDIFDRLATSEGAALLQIVDAYAYRDRATMDIPKMYLNATGDQFFTPGSSEYYIHTMQSHGETLLYNAPNAGHSLDMDSRYNALYFCQALLLGASLPDIDWTISDDGKRIDVTVDGNEEAVKVWTASNSVDRDYRYGMSNATAWTSTDLSTNSSGNYSATVATPTTGSVAFMIEITCSVGILFDVKFSTSISVVSADDSNVIRGNLIGTDASATAALGNGGDGINLVDCTNTLVADNLLAASGGAGVGIEGMDATGSMLLGNTFGSGTLANATAAFLVEEGAPSSRYTVLQPQGNNLVLSGTAGNDTLGVNLSSTTGYIGAAFNGSDLGVFPISPLGQMQVNGGSGTDTLNVTALATNDTIQVTNDTTLVVNGTSIVADGVESRVAYGGAGTDTLVGPEAATTWHITGGGAGSLTTTLSFQQVENLTGGSQDDIFRVHSGGSLAGALNGGGGTNVLDYSYYNSGVTVNLGSGSATAISGGISGFNIAVGSSSGDTLRGSEGDDILIGGAGGDDLLAAGGRDLVFGGTGADTIHTGSGDDILANGTLSYYDQQGDLSINLTALKAVMAEWTRTDADYSTRVSHLLNGGGLNGSYRLYSGTVFGDGAIDLLYGESGRDWFLAAWADWCMDRASNETRTTT